MTNTNPQILEEAAEWLIEFNSEQPDAEAREKFDAWLRLSPQHVRAYLELLPVWEDGVSLPLDEGATAEQFIALGKSDTRNIVALRATPERCAEPAVISTFRKSRYVALAVSMLLTVAATLFLYATYFSGVYTTGIGEQRSIALDDGSTIELNARTQIRVRYSDLQRNVELLEGQALFQVAKNVERPFIVHSGDTQVRAVGTQFDVNRRSASTIVTVIEGKVAVSGAGGTAAPKGSTASALFLTAGEQTTVSGAATPRAAHANLTNTTAWTQRRLVFDDATLGEVIEEFNRYNRVPLRLQDASLEEFPITAAFSSTDPSSLVNFLRVQPGIRVTESDGEIQISSQQ